MTVPGELARVIGIPRWEAGLGNRALVAEGFATSPSRGVYVLAIGTTAAPIASEALDMEEERDDREDVDDVTS
ncbi:MAG: hypothetical protein QM736_10640 [Vicinamibacterales bacterium]